MASAVFRKAWVQLLAFLAMFISHEANAQPHPPIPKWEDTAGPGPEPDVWLRRLVGRYRFEGLIQAGPQADGCGPLPGAAEESMPAETCTGVKGMGDCVGIGTGPGVQCVLNVTWIDLWIQSDTDVKAAAISYLDPAMILIGLDPGNSAFNYMLVNNKGLTEAGLGFISGNRVTFKNKLCATRSLHCVPSMHFEAKPDSDVLYLRIEYEPDDVNAIDDTPFPDGGSVVMTLRRVPENEPNAISPKPSLSR
jgi:hypothetical protein